MLLKSSTHRVNPGETISLNDFPTQMAKLVKHRDAIETEFLELRRKLINLQYRLYAEGKRKLLVVFQAMDCGGKDGTIRHVFQGVNSQGVEVTSFKAPNSEELAHDFLWRIHRAVPRAGMIGLFNRSHYEDVVAVRVMKLVPESVWRPRFEMINHFEELLTESGTTIIKIFLLISKDQQRKRLQARIDNPEKRWKFELDDLKKRKDWDEYVKAYSEAISHCNRKQAPWYVIPADRRWYRNAAITKIVVETLEKMDLHYPEAKIDWNNLVVE
ncbi:MAG: polyphosphate kinase 2 family protein [Planctomycetota bacterium]|nr:polyphosphate kinase 2 family protein [Planctomycetota bacterium]MDA1215092.1 polyphosphate kinase 2 family protein [Planctomycetota bacterium]